MTESPNPISDYQAIAAVVDTYVQGARSGRGGDMKPAFHHDATMFGYAGEELFAGPIQQLYDWNDGNGPAADLKVWISAIDLVGTAGSVRVELEDWTGHRFTDLFTVLKIDGRWRFVSKVFYLHPGKADAAIA